MSCSNSVSGDSIDDHLHYLGISTGCNDANTENIELLKTFISKESIVFYEQFEKIVVDCETEGFIKDIALP